MSEVRDPAIKLFGKTIPLLPKRQFSVLTTAKRTHFVAAADDDDHEQKQQNSSISSSEAEKSCVRVGDAQEDGKKLAQSEVIETIREDDSSHRTFEELKDLQTSCDNPKTPSLHEEPNSPKPSKNEEQSETSNSQEKTLKKPDKIAPCPRCNSMDTKFCYYNNYNINQPRHFCKNCQRYWTAGGTMRNVPVGSGRRKNKSSPASLHYQHVLVSECLQAARANAGNGLHHPVLGTDGSTVLSFGSDSQPVCESIASALDLEENPQNRVKTPVSCGKGENGDDQTSRTSDLVDKGGKGNSVFQEPIVMNFPWPPWPFPWNSPQWRAAIPPPTLSPTGLPIAFYPPPPPPYWGCAAPPGSWNVPWLSPPLASPDTPAVCPSPNMPTLGKHSRNVADKEDHSKGNNSEGGVWIPKTLRIDDPNEAAKSSIWSTLGIIKNEKNESINAGGGLFKAFQSKGDEKQHIADTSLALQTNPAALSRSFNFHESV